MLNTILNKVSVEGTASLKELQRSSISESTNSHLLDATQASSMLLSVPNNNYLHRHGDNMEKLIEIWEKVLFHLSEFWEMISLYIAKVWEAISPFVMSVWGKFLSEFCQFGFVCSDGKLNWMGGTVIAFFAVAIIVLIFAVIFLVRNI